MKDGKCDLFFVLDVLLAFDNLDLNKKNVIFLKERKSFVLDLRCSLNRFKLNYVFSLVTKLSLKNSRTTAGLKLCSFKDGSEYY